MPNLYPDGVCVLWRWSQVGRDKVHPAISLVGYEDQLQPAMEYVFGSTFVCDSLQNAKKVRSFESHVILLTLPPHLTLLHLTLLILPPHLTLPHLTLLTLPPHLTLPHLTSSPYPPHLTSSSYPPHLTLLT